MDEITIRILDQDVSIKEAENIYSQLALMFGGTQFISTPTINHDPRIQTPFDAPLPQGCDPFFIVGDDFKKVEITDV